MCLTLFNAMLKAGVDAHLIVLKKKCDYLIDDSTNIHFLFDDDKVRLYSVFVQKRAASRLKKLLKQLGSFDGYFSNLDYSHAVLSRTELPNSFFVVHNSIEQTLKMHRRLGPIKYWRKRRAINRLNGKELITVSEGIKQEILDSHVITAKSITTIYNPIDLDELVEQSNQQDSEVPCQPYILFMGRIAKQKRVDNLLRAFSHLKSEVSLVVLTSNLKKLNKLVAKYVTDRERVMGINFKQNPYPLVRNAKALVLSSDFEGLGMVLIEALACGTPAVSTDCPHGPNEILTGELARFLAPVNNPRTLAEKIDQAIGYNVTSPEILEKVKVDHVVSQYLKLLDL